MTIVHWLMIVVLWWFIVVNIRKLHHEYHEYRMLQNEYRVLQNATPDPTEKEGKK